MTAPLHVIRDLLDRAENQGVRSGRLRRLLHYFLRPSHRRRARRRQTLAVRPR